ncbi:MAG: lysophospholipid acyltransferase family protein [Chlorobiaceae bacterium]
MKRNGQKKDNIADRALYRLFIIFGVFIRSVSRSTSTSIAHFIGNFVYDILKTRRKLVEENLARTFPEKTSIEINTIARRVYCNQAENIIEMFRLPMMRSAEDVAQVLDVDARHIFAATIDCKKGGVLVSAHFGNWELMAICGGILLAPLTVVVKRLKNHEVDRQINAWRTMLGNRIIYKGRALREGLRTLQNGGILSILGDQSDPQGVFFMEFLGRRTPVFLGPAFLALKAGVPIFVAMCRRTGGGRFIVDIEKIDISGLSTAKTDVEELARRYTKVLESYIYRYPEEWFWLHNRWKRVES